MHLIVGVHTVLGASWAGLCSTHEPDYDSVLHYWHSSIALALFAFYSPPPTHTHMLSACSFFLQICWPTYPPIHPSIHPSISSPPLHLHPKDCLPSRHVIRAASDRITPTFLPFFLPLRLPAAFSATLEAVIVRYTCCSGPNTVSQYFTYSWGGGEEEEGGQAGGRG